MKNNIIQQNYICKKYRHTCNQTNPLHFVYHSHRIRKERFSTQSTNDSRMKKADVNKISSKKIQKNKKKYKVNIKNKKKKARRSKKTHDKIQSTFIYPKTPHNTNQYLFNEVYTHSNPFLSSSCTCYENLFGSSMIGLFSLNSNLGLSRTTSILSTSSETSSNDTNEITTNIQNQILEEQQEQYSDTNPHPSEVVKELKDKIVNQDKIISLLQNQLKLKQIEK